MLVAVGVGTALLAGLAAYAQYNAGVPAAASFRNLEAAAALWGVGELAIFLSPPDLAWLDALYTARLFASSLSAVLVIVFIAEYTQSDLLNRLGTRVLLWGGYAAGVLLWLLNPGGLAYDALPAATFQGITVVNPTFGLGFSLYFLFIYTFFLVAFVVLGAFLLDSTNVYRKQAGLILLAFLVVVVGTVVLLVGLSPQEGLDLGTAFNALGGLLIWIAIYRYEFLTVVPLAKESIIETIADPVVVVDQDDRLIYANRAAEHVGIDDWQRDEALESVLPGIETAIEEDGLFGYEVDEPEADKSFEPAATDIVDHHGIERGRVIVLHDVTERIQREQRLDEFASIVSHDLRNPLNVAQGYVDIARESDDVDALDPAADALDRMDQLIDDLLTVSRAGYEDLETSQLSLAAIAEAAWASVETGAATLRTEGDLTLDASGSQLQELFENLFRNAIEHNDEPVTVRVEAREDGFAVADDGAGITEEERSQLFEPGFTTDDQGTGLGLYIVRQIADAHGWQLSVHESVDGGVRFEFGLENGEAVTRAASRSTGGGASDSQD